MKYIHTNIISKNWKKLADFYIEVFKCVPLKPERDLHGEWLAKATGVPNAALKGIHLLLPGYGKEGPTIEIFQYNKNEKKINSISANREGYQHIAFSVEDVEQILQKMIQLGGRKIGEVVTKDFKNGTLTFTYAADPEGNIVEIQKWEPKTD